MKKSDKPRSDCRFKIRKDLDSYIAFFQMKGVITLNEIAAYILSQIDGKNSIQDITRLVKKQFPEIKYPYQEVVDLVKNLCEAGYLIL